MSDRWLLTRSTSLECFAEIVCSTNQTMAFICSFTPQTCCPTSHLPRSQLPVIYGQSSSWGGTPATGLVGECSTPRRLWSFLLSRRSLQLRPTLYPRLDLVVIGWGSSRTSVGLSISPLPPNVKDCTQAVGTCSYSFAVIGKFSTSHVTAQKALYNKENNDPEEEMSS